MTDKQIIIDGVDVSGCDFYDKNKKYCLTLKMDTTGFKNPSCFSGDFQKCIQDSKTCPNTFCDNNPNCHYKQLKRKEQENKDLREDIKDIANLLDLDTGEEYNFGNIELEIKQLKAKEQECEELKESVSELITMKEDDIKRINNAIKLKQTLTEIKTDILDIREGLSYFWVIDKCDEILQKISECEGNQ